MTFQIDAHGLVCLLGLVFLAGVWAQRRWPGDENTL